MAKLSIDSATPSKDNTLIAKCGSMIIAKRKFQDEISTQFFEKPWLGLLLYIHIAETAEFSTAPCKDFSF
jgi:hypothetical protein